MSEDLENRITKLEVTVSDHTKQLEKQLDKNESLVKLSTLMEMQIEMNKEQNVTMKKFGETLDRVDKNLDNLNSSQQTLNTNQQKLGERVDDIETTLQEAKIDPTKLIFKILGYVGGFVSSLVLAYLLFKFGWNNDN